MFDSISDEEIRRNKGKSFQDVTSLRDPLMGLPFESPESEEPDPFELAAQDSLAEDFDPDQPRDKDGKWTKVGGFGGQPRRLWQKWHGWQQARRIWGRGRLWK